MNATHPRLLLLALIACPACLLLLGGCADIATVDRTTPLPPVAAAAESPALATARREALEGLRFLSDDPSRSAVHSLRAVQASLRVLGEGSGRRSREAEGWYNFSVARLLEAIIDLKRPWDRDVRLAPSDGSATVRVRNASGGAWIPDRDQLVASDRLEIGGQDFPSRTRIDGAGAPFVSIGAGRGTPWSPPKHYYGVTALATPADGAWDLSIVDPSRTPRTGLAGTERPVAADLSAPLALRIVEAHPEGLSFGMMLHVDKYQKASLYMVEPYRADRIPVVLVHGLKSSPITWVPLCNALMADPAFRARYQIWVFQYPTGYAFPMSAAFLRQALADVYRRYPATPPAVLIGHSMGGMLVHMVVGDSGGDRFCRDVIGKPLDQLSLTAGEKAELRSVLMFQASPYVSEAIFVATPHRGAKMASGGIGRFIASLIHLPLKLALAGPKLLAQLTASPGEQLLHRFPNGIDSLRPEARMVKAEAKLPIRIPYHSIIGDRGRGDTPNSFDGLVPYWSSHLDGAASEKIVPSDHDAHECPQGIAEIRRILREHPDS